MNQRRRSQVSAALLCFVVGVVGCASDVEEVDDESTSSGLWSSAVKLTSPTTGSTVSGTVPVTAVAGSRVSWVNFYVDSQWVASSPPYTFAWDSTKVPNGMHTLSVTAKDAQNHVLGTRSVRVNVVNAKANTSGGGSSGTTEGGGTSTPPATTPPTQGKAVLLSKAAFIARGGALADAEALARVVATPEKRPENATANATYPTDADLPKLIKDSWGGTSEAAAYQKKISGRPGRALTTDEIIQWVAHKWGIDEDAFRAVAVQESSWRQSSNGDFTTTWANCPSNPDTTVVNGVTECAESYGLISMKVRYHAPSAWPLQRTSTPYNVDYLGAYYRAMMDGYITWIADRTPTAGYPSYGSGTTDDVFWGAVGCWYSGGWYDSGALDYIGRVKNHLAKRTWTTTF